MKSKGKKRKRLTMNELVDNAEKLLKEKESKKNGKEEFEKALNKTLPSYKKRLTQK